MSEQTQNTVETGANAQATQAQESQATDAQKTVNAESDAAFYKKMYDETNAALSSLAEEIYSEVPENYKTLIPDMPVHKKLIWIRKAVKSGIFNACPTCNSPDSKITQSKQAVDLDGMTSTQKMALGYK